MNFNKIKFKSHVLPQNYNVLHYGIHILVNFDFVKTLSADFLTSILTRETNVVTYCLLFCTPIPFRNPLLKGVHSNRKEFAPVGTASLLSHQTLFQKGEKKILTDFSPLKVYQFS